jgi:hypothetical protein
MVRGRASGRATASATRIACRRLRPERRRVEVPVPVPLAVGKRRLEKALSKVGKEKFEINCKHGPCACAHACLGDEGELEGQASCCTWCGEWAAAVCPWRQREASSRGTYIVAGSGSQGILCSSACMACLPGYLAEGEGIVSLRPHCGVQGCWMNGFLSTARATEAALAAGILQAVDVGC